LPFFSLIVPIYNVEEFLADCLDSCIHQSYKDLEIICVNDCSPDGSDKILEEYAKKDSRVIIFNHEHNKGLGGARNTGIEAATGKYIWFIDSDDMIPIDACEYLYSVIEETSEETPVDVIRFDMSNFHHNATARLGAFKFIEKCDWPYHCTISKNNHEQLGATGVTVINLIVSSSLAKKFRFRENVFHEDIDFGPIIFSEAEKIYCVNTSLYFRRRHSKSITGGGITVQRQLVDTLAALNSLADYIVTKKLSKANFCVKNLHHTMKIVKKEYIKYPEIHTAELDAIIKKAENQKIVFQGNLNLYNKIISNYGNTKLLEFILRSYNFLMKILVKIIPQLKKNMPMNNLQDQIRQG